MKKETQIAFESGPVFIIHAHPPMPNLALLFPRQKSKKRKLNHSINKFGK